MLHKLVLLWSALWVLSPGTRADPVRIGYQTSVVPTAVAIVDGAFARDAGVPIDWRRFDSGAEVIRAMASGDIDIGSVGSSLVAAAAARDLPIETFLIASQLGISEALVVRNGSGISGPQDLVGKTVAVPFVSTCHYSLLAALAHWGLDRTRVKIVNLRPAEIPAAWARGDIDAAYVWDPALGRIKETGTVLATSVDAARWGAPTYDVWVVRRDFSAQHAPFLRAFARTSLSYMRRYAADPGGFAGAAANVGDIVKATGAKAADVPGMLAGNIYPTADRQRVLLEGPFVQAVADTAAFLKSQGKIDVVLPDYHAYATARFLPPASAPP
jgi:taurine transport system substrate-binding protein